MGNAVKRQAKELAAVPKGPRLLACPKCAQTYTDGKKFGKCARCGTTIDKRFYLRADLQAGSGYGTRRMAAK